MQLAPILERTRGQGGLRIYHESFRRHLLEKAAAQPGILGAPLKDVIAWLDGKGFLTDPRAFRFLLPNLIRAERANEVFSRIDRDFVVKAVRREKGTGYLIGILPASRAVSRIARIRHSVAPIRSHFPPVLKPRCNC